MNRRTILVVEPEILIRHPLAEYLRECGLEVVEAVNPDEARRIIIDGAKTVHVVLADVKSWGESGFALASWIRANGPQIEVALAGTLAKTVEKAGALCGEGTPLSKPYDHQLVHDHIRRLLAAKERRDAKA
jgi:DNA-binding NtrC family response regulator